nr:unnamed protein product [Callosobruchus analis]
MAFQRKTITCQPSNITQKKIKFSTLLQQKVNKLNDLAWLRKHIKDIDLEIKFRKLKKEVDVDIREEKIKFYHSIITKSSNKQKATSNLVNSVKGTHKNTAIRELVYENITITHSADIANALVARIYYN